MSESPMSADSPHADSGEEGTHLPPVVNNSGADGSRQGNRATERKFNLRGGNSQYSLGGERSGGGGGGNPYSVPVVSQQGMMRSVTLLNDLQAYIQSVESLAAQRKAEVELLLQEKKDNDRLQRLIDRSKGVNLNLSAADENSPQVRALVEDNKMMKDRIRKYKDRCRDMERQHNALGAQNLKLADKIKELSRALEECSRTPAMVAEEKEHEGQLKEKEAQIKDLEWKLNVAEKSRDAEAKKGRAQTATHAKEVETLQAQVAALKKAVEDKEKEVRADHLKIKLLKKKVEEGARPKPAIDTSNSDGAGGSSDADASLLLSPIVVGGAGGVDHWAGAGSTPLAWNPVQLQIVVQQVTGCDGQCACGGLAGYDAGVAKSPDQHARSEGGPAMGQGAFSLGGPAGLDTDDFGEHPQSPASAAVPAAPSAAGRGAAGGDAGTAAAVRIQASFRGHRVRKKSHTQRTAAVKVQAAFRGHRVRKRAAEMGMYSLTHAAKEGGRPGTNEPAKASSPPGRDKESSLSASITRKGSLNPALSINPGKGLPSKDSPAGSPKGTAGQKQPWVQPMLAKSPTLARSPTRTSLSRQPSMKVATNSPNSFKR